MYMSTFPYNSKGHGLNAESHEAQTDTKQTPLSHFGYVHLHNKQINKDRFGHFVLSVGHIGIAVPDVYAACKLFEEQGVTFVKKPDDGGYQKLKPNQLEGY